MTVEDTRLFKVLGAGQASHHGGTGKWRKGVWRTVEGDLVPCENGIHYCRADQLVRWLGPQIWVFEDGSPEETIDHGDKMVTRKGRVVERVEAWTPAVAQKMCYAIADHAVRVTAVDALRAAGMDASRLEDWLIGYLSETDEHAAKKARRARAALDAGSGGAPE